VYTVYQNKLRSVKNDFDNSNIVEAQESISKITSDLEGMAYLHSSDGSYITALTNAYLYKEICFSKGGLDDKENAMKAFNKALELNPNHEQAKLGLRKVELSFGIDSQGLPIARKFK
jgi:tetratricopeptide (TPR) repeat protein